MDLRERVVAAVDAGMTQGQAAERFGVSLRTVERYLARRRATGSLVATEQRHGPEPTVRRQLQAWLPDRLAAAVRFSDGHLDRLTAAAIRAAYSGRPTTEAEAREALRDARTAIRDIRSDAGLVRRLRGVYRPGL